MGNSWLILQDLFQRAEELLGDGTRVLRSRLGNSDAQTIPRGFAFYRADRPQCAAMDDDAQRSDWATHAMENKIARV